MAGILPSAGVVGLGLGFGLGSGEPPPPPPPPQAASVRTSAGRIIRRFIGSNSFCERALCERTAQPPFCLVNAGLDRAYGRLQLLGDVAMPHVVEVVHRDRLPLQGRQRRDGARELEAVDVRVEVARAFGKVRRAGAKDALPPPCQALTAARFVADAREQETAQRAFFG